MYFGVRLVRWYWFHKQLWGFLRVRLGPYGDTFMLFEFFSQIPYLLVVSEHSKATGCAKVKYTRPIWNSNRSCILYLCTPYRIQILQCRRYAPKGLSPIWQVWQLPARVFALFQCLHGLPCPWEAQKCHESQPIKSNKELKNRSKIAYSKKTVPLEKGP